MYGLGYGYRAVRHKGHGGRKSIKIPAGANAIVAFKRFGDYNGPCIRVARASDGAQLDIGFDANGNVDTAAWAAFAGVSRTFIVTRYDQSGSGNHPTQPTAANRPTFVPSNAWEGMLSCTHDSGPGGSGPSKHLILPDTFTFNRQSQTVFIVEAPNSTWNQNALFELGKDATTRMVVFTGTTPALRMICDAGGSIDIPKTAQARPQILGWRFSPTALTTYYKNTSGAFAAKAAGTAIGGRLGGTTVNGTGFNYRGESYCFISYPRPLSDQEVADLRGALAAAYPAAAPQAFTRTLIIDGDSISEGYGATDLVNNFRILVRDLGAAGLDVYNQSVFGTVSNTIYDSRLTRYAGIDKVAGKTAALFCVGSNDINAGLTAANAWQDGNGKGILPHILYMKSIGIAPAVGTILNRVPINGSPSKLAELNALNATIRDNAATYGYPVADYAAIPQLANPSDVSMFPDGTHPSSPAYALMEQVARPAVQQAWAA